MSAGDKMWLYYNFFQSDMRLSEKVILPAQDGRSSRVKRRFDDARTPFDRQCATDALAARQQAHLRALSDATNPRQLRQQIYDLLDRLFRLPNALPGSTHMCT